ncbi:MAG: indolepyruvate ferredoxin oxidoreductase family protein [Pseudomonadales bacterium]|nr:indolepyruvate ferredoxin oxidoreductase family protein [Pseudomonadales bacterium]
MLQDLTLEDKYLRTEGHVFLTGIQALTRLPMLQHQKDRAAGLKTAGYISGYRGSPLGGLDKTLWQAEAHLKQHDVYFQPGLNEDLAATSVWGSQQVNMFAGAKYDGVFSMWYGKGPGIDRSGDVFKHANHAGTSKNGGVLVVAGDDHGCKSSTLPHQTEYAFVDAMMPILNPTGVQDVIDLGLYGWALSRYSGCWVALKTIAEVLDASSSIAIDINRTKIIFPQTPAPDLHIRWPDKPLDQELRLHGKKLAAALEFSQVNQLNRITMDSKAPRIGIISTGKAYLDVLQALQDLGIDRALADEIGIRLYKVSMPWPLEPEGIKTFASGLTEVLVVEEKRGLVEDQVTSQLYNWHTEVRPIVVGKRDEQGNWLLPATGELSPALIARVIAARIRRFFASEKMAQRLAFLNEKESYLNQPRNIIERTPHYCSGCPHNTSTVIPEGSRAMGGIGCHYMATWMDRETHTFTQMGGEGATWIGQAPFTDTSHIFQNLGDGTYFHSGILAIRASIAAKVNITYKILFNDAVAMTGGQSVDGHLSVEQLSQQLAAEGVQHIVVVSEDHAKYISANFPRDTHFRHRDNLDSTQRKLREIKGTSVLIYDQTCAAEKRRRRKRSSMPDTTIRPFINSLVCEGCGDCGIASNCLSIAPDETEYGRKRKIEQSSCNKDMSCIKGFCPSFVTVNGALLKKPKNYMASINTADLPTPELPAFDMPYGIVLAGIGGTGVTTLGAILGTAAHMEGNAASILDMTGLAQKFGAVITHIQIARAPEDIYAPRIAAGGASLVIGCDLVVAAGNDSTVKVKRNHAYAVINDHTAMVAEFTRNPDAAYPGQSMQKVIRESVGEDRCHFTNANAATEQLLGNTMPANLYLAGFAYQKGYIPISAAAIIKAIELNATAVDENVNAFNLGRLQANSAAKLFQQEEGPTPLTSLELIVKDRAEYLTKYQNAAYAKNYLRKIEQFATKATPALARDLAINYFKLLAYKDEYEVARLYSDGTFKNALQAQFEPGAKLTFHLAPPLIAPINENTLLPMKMAVGDWIMPAFKILAKFKFLRGTKLDPFSYTEDRKLERQLIREYERTVDICSAHLTPANQALISEILCMPQKIRGFGHLKLAQAKKADIKTQRLLANLTARPEIIKIFKPRAA